MCEKEYRCHFCGEDLDKNGYEFNGTRHYLSDCRPDLVEHEIGDTCTWAYRRKDKNLEGLTETFPENQTCYAYQNGDTQLWTNEHKYFYPDGPM